MSGFDLIHTYSSDALAQGILKTGSLNETP